MEMIPALDALGALAQGTRLATVRRLVKAGPAGMAAGDVADALECRQNTMSSHLKLLHQAGLVHQRREGRSIIYSANFGTLRELILYLMEDCCAGSPNVCHPVADSFRETTKERS